MKRTCLILIVFTLVTGFAAAMAASDSTAIESVEPATLNVYCYDSFASEWGPGLLIAEEFTAETGIEIVYHAPGDAVTVLNQLILEEGNSPADVVIGLDSSLLERALESDLLTAYESPALSKVNENLIFDSSYKLLPYDYGHFAIVYDSVALTEVPGSLEDLTKAEYEDSLVLMDPRTSTPGLGFLLWTVAVYGDEWPSYWERLMPSILTIADGWSQGYALFTAGEAPMVLSYGTSPVYHLMWEETEQFKTAEFSDGHVAQIEGMGILKSTKNQKAAEAFIDFMLSSTAQLNLATANIMLPVVDDVELPESFDIALRPSKVLELPEGVLSAAETEAIISRWTEVFSR